MGSQADYRKAATDMLEGCATAANVALQVYPGRPMTIYPPTGFVDSMSDTLSPTPGASALFTHAPTVEVLLLWGEFDSKEAVTQRDAFVDAFHAYVRTRPHQAGAATLIGPRSLGDVPVYNPDWGSEDQRQRSYYATRIVLEGFATD